MSYNLTFRSHWMIVSTLFSNILHTSTIFSRPVMCQGVSIARLFFENKWRKIDSFECWNYWVNNSIIKSIRSISQKSKFYRRVVSKFLYTMRNLYGIFYSFYREYELKILRVSVKLAYLDIYFTEKHARRRPIGLTVLLRLQHFSCFSNIRAECCKNYWLYQKRLQTKVAQNQISCKKLNGSRFYLPQEWN